MGSRHHKAVLCDTRYKDRRTCVAKKSAERPVPCPRCEGYRAGTIDEESGEVTYESFVARRLIGWIPKNGIQVPLYTDGQRPKR